MKYRLICAAMLCAITLPALATPTQLPRNVSPRHYALTITPDAAASRFSGHVDITLDVLAPTNTITLNAVDLAFQRAVAAPANGKGTALAAAVSVNVDEQSARFRFKRALAKGSYTLSLDYTGVIGQQAVGLFSLDYDSGSGKQRALYTQFENSDARRMIPSWDEPAYKASFDLEAIVPGADTAISNMPVASSRILPDGRKAVRFAQTPRMSTYLLFFGSGDFERATATVDGTEVGVVTTRGKTAQAAFALEASQQVIGEYNDYFGVRYPLPKLDNVAAPGHSQFFGAMENWGAIMTFESGMLLDPAMSSQSDREGVFTFAAHEIAHQWFGNLVTMRWWDDLWLNEGFATWMEMRTSRRLHPEWHSELGAVASRDGAMVRDSIATAHPIIQRINTVEQASQAFDEITYQKGAAVIGMLEDYVGPEAWRAGVRSYIDRHAYANTVSDDLWHEVEKAAQKPVTAIAHDFTLQAGVPMIRVQSSACRDGHTELALVQDQFRRDQQGARPLHWRVPVAAQLVGGAQARILVDGKATLTLPGCGPVMVNAGQNGYFRTLYAPAVLAPLVAQFAALAPIDQIGLLADTSSMGLAGFQPASDFLDLVKATPADADPQVWTRVAYLLDSTSDMYGKDKNRRDLFNRFAIARLAPVMAKVGWDARAGESSTIVNLRENLILTLAALGDPDTIAQARKRYAEPATNSPALRRTVLEIVARYADTASWDAMRAQAQAEKSPLIKDQLYTLLAASKDPGLAKRALDLALTEEPGLTISAEMIERVSGLHPEMAFEFALRNMAKVNERVDGTSRSRYFPRLASSSVDPATPARLKAYAQQHLGAEARGEVEAVIADIRSRIAMRAQRLPAIDMWLARHSAP